MEHPNSSYIILPAKEVKEMCEKMLDRIFKIKIDWLNDNYKIFADYMNSKKKKWWQWKEPRRFDATLCIKKYVPEDELPKDMKYFIDFCNGFNKTMYYYPVYNLISDSSFVYTDRYLAQINFIQNLLAMANKILSHPIDFNQNMYISRDDYRYIG